MILECTPYREVFGRVWGINPDFYSSASRWAWPFADPDPLQRRRCPQFAEFLEGFAKLPNLTKLSLDGAGPSDNPIAISTYPAIHLPHLHTLVLANFAAPFTTSIVSHFKAPHVRDLTIMNFRGEYYGPFYEYMTGRFREIRLLTLYTTNCPPAILPRMIKWLDSMHPAHQMVC